MNIPFPPTDNLYKFIAIFGLVLFILINISQYFMNENLMPKLEKIVTDHSDVASKAFQMAIDTMMISEYQKRNNKNFNTFASEAEQIRKSIISQNHIISDDTLRRFKMVGDSLMVIADSLYRAKVFLESKLKLNRRTQEELQSNEKLVINTITLIVSTRYWLIGVSFSMIFFGFFLWYMKYQRYQDIIIKGEAEKYMENKSNEINKSIQNKGIIK